MFFSAGSRREYRKLDCLEVQYWLEKQPELSPKGKLQGSRLADLGRFCLIRASPNSLHRKREGDKQGAPGENTEVGTGRCSNYYPGTLQRHQV